MVIKMKKLSFLAPLLGCTAINKTDHESLIASLQNNESDSGIEQDTSAEPEDTSIDPGLRNSHFIDFSEDNHYIALGEVEDLSVVLDWTKNWSISFYLPHALSPTDGALTLMRNGENWIGLSPNEDSFDVYLSNQGDSDNDIVVAEASETLEEHCRITFTHRANTSEMRLYINGRRIDDFVIEPPENNGDIGEISIGQSTGTTRARNWLSGLDNMFVTNSVLSRSEIGLAVSEDGPGASGDISQHAWYTNVVVGWWLMGEDTFPTVYDLKYGNHGSFENGVEDNFVSY